MCERPNIRFPQNIPFKNSKANIFNRRIQHEKINVEKSYEMAREKELTRINRDLMSMSSELKELKIAQFVDAKKRQQLRQNCEELRLLEKQLQNAIIYKELIEQHEDVERRRQICQRAKKEGQARAASEHLKAFQYEQEKQEKRREDQRKMRETLTSQIQETQKQRLSKYQNLLEERYQQDAIRRQIEMEDKQLKLEREQQMTKARNEMLLYLDMNAAFKEKEKNEMNEANIKNLNYQNEIHEQRRLLEEQKKLEIKQKIDKSELMGLKLMEIEEKKRQREELLLDLMIQERKAKEDSLYRQQLEQEHQEHQRAKHELMLYRIDLKARQEQRAKEKKEEAMRTKAKLESRDEEKQFLAELKEQHQKRLQHGNELLVMIEENRRQRAENTAENIIFLAMQDKERQAEKKLINEERIKMLRALPPDVLRYLPNGVLRDSDYEHISLPPKN